VEAEQEESNEEISSEEESDAVSGVWSNLSDPIVETTTVDKSVRVGRRIAVTNLDWDNISATDLFVLFQSFIHNQNKGGSIEKVEVFPSLFGLEQMKKDTTYGPPKEMFSHARKKRHRRTKDGDEGDSDQDFKLDEHDDGGDMA